MRYFVKSTFWLENQFGWVFLSQIQFKISYETGPQKFEEIQENNQIEGWPKKAQTERVERDKKERSCILINHIHTTTAECMMQTYLKFLSVYKRKFAEKVPTSHRVFFFAKFCELGSYEWCSNRFYSKLR